MTIEFGACIGTYNIPPVGPSSTYVVWLDPGDSPQAVKADFPGDRYLKSFPKRMGTAVFFLYSRTRTLVTPEHPD